ncbi:MAG: recombinase family protein [Chloroflexota bacterium]|nr:recombinase family protein [Chloroflexota bacterium]
MSSSGQEDNSSLETQEAGCRTYAVNRGWTVTGVFREVHSGAELFERPQLTLLRDAMRRHEFDVLLVYALDRLSRKQTHQGLILSEAEHAGVEWNSATEDIDDSPQGQILRAVIGGMAEMERLKIAERTQRGKRARIESGKYNVGSHAPFGYTWEDPATKARLVENPATAPIVRRIFREIADGGSARQMALRLTAEGVPTPKGIGTDWYWSTIRTIVRNPLYWGEPRAYRWKRERVKGYGVVTRPRPESEQIALPGVAPALVSPEVAAAVHAGLARNKLEATRNNKSPKSALLRAGYARCGYCGHLLEVQHARGGWMYRCGTSNRDKHKCPAFSIMAPILDSVVWSKVEEILSKPEIIAAEVERLQRSDTTNDDLSALERRIAELRRQRTNLTKRLALFDDDETAAPLVAEIESLARQQRQLEAEQAEIRSVRDGWELAQSRLEELEYWCRVQSENLAFMTYEQKRLALRALNADVRVWATNHTPRYLITLRVDGVVRPGLASDLHLADGAVHGEEHVDDYTRRGCANRGGHRGDRL